MDIYEVCRNIAVGQVLHDQLLMNPPGLDGSKGSRL